MNAKYAFIDSEKANYTIRLMCLWSHVSRSGFYDWVSRGQSVSAARRERLTLILRKAFADSDGTYGYRRLHAVMQRWNEPCSPELVRALAADAGLVPCQPRPFRPTTTIPGTGNVPDLLARDFTATAPGTKLCGDITYIRTWQGWMYLATVLDCYTKECIGWAIADHMRTELITDALNMAARNRVLAPRAIFHSDRGAQYMSADFTARCAELNLRRSVGRTGVCWDNAWAESFNAAVKVERVNRTEYPTKRHAITDVAQYIELRYNTIRLHSALGYRTPREMHDEYYEAKIAA